MVGKLIWILLENCPSLQQQKKFTNQSRTDKVIAMVRLAQFFSESQCICRTLVCLFVGFLLSGIVNKIN